MSAARRLALRIGCALAAALLAGCGSVSALKGVARGDRGPIAVVAVVAADGIDTLLSRASMDEQLYRALLDAERSPVASAAVARALGGDRMASLGDEFARDGALSADSIQLLMATPLNARRALLVRLEADETGILEPRSEPMREAGGRVLTDRRAIVLSSRRNVRVAATSIDLRTGAAVWRRAWTATPIATRRYVAYSGSSFAGSVAATLANTVVNGVKAPAAPPPPPLRDTLAAIYHQLVDELP